MALLDGLLNLLSIDTTQTPDGGYALTVGNKFLNAGIKFGGNTGVEVWGEAGPAYSRAGIGNDAAGVYGVAGIDNLYEVGGYAGTQGAAAYVSDAKKGTLKGAGWSIASGFGAFSYDGASQTLTPTKGTDEAVNYAAQLVTAMGNAFGGRASVASGVPALQTGPSGLGDFLAGLITAPGA